MSKKILASAILFLMMSLGFSNTLNAQPTPPDIYKVQVGDSLWKISQRFSVTLDDIRKFNTLTTDTIYVGQYLKLKQEYIVKSGDTLLKIATDNNISVTMLKLENNLTNDWIYVGQKLIIPKAFDVKILPTAPPWPTVTYIVYAGDTVESVAKKFNTSVQNILNYNYMRSQDWLNEGEKIAINGYAPRLYTVKPGEDILAKSEGKLVDWFLDGQYILRRADIFTVTDVRTGKQFRLQMFGGYNHCDVETLTAQDTATMLQLWGGQWGWNPRSVVVFKDGMNMAASLSGMPHSYEAILDNGVKGHFDLYLYNSKPHAESVSLIYLQQHKSAVFEAAKR